MAVVKKREHSFLNYFTEIAAWAPSSVDMRGSCPLVRSSDTMIGGRGSGGMEWLGYGNAFFRALEFANLEPEIWNFRDFPVKIRPLNIFRTLENDHSIRHQSIPPISASRNELRTARAMRKTSVLFLPGVGHFSAKDNGSKKIGRTIGNAMNFSPQRLRCPDSRCTVRSGSNRTYSQRFKIERFESQPQIPFDSL